MNTTLTKAILAASLTVTGSQAAVLLDDTFNYTNGNLVGQGSWGQTGSVATTPVQVVDGAAVLATGQDVYKGLSATQTLADVGSLYFGLDFSIQTATANGDYFFHTSPTVGDSSIFVGRLFARSSGTGFQLGLLETSGTGTIAYGTTVLDFNTDYKAVVVWNSITGATNDVFSLYIDPLSGTQSSNTLYISRTWSSTTAEPATVAAINLRQAGGNAAGVTIDRVVVATTFAEAAVIPEPGSYAVLLGGVALLGALTRRRRA